MNQIINIAPLLLLLRITLTLSLPRARTLRTRRLEAPDCHEGWRGWGAVFGGEFYFRHHPPHLSRKPLMRQHLPHHRPRILHLPRLQLLLRLYSRDYLLALLGGPRWEGGLGEGASLRVEELRGEGDLFCFLLDDPLEFEIPPFIGARQARRFLFLSAFYID